MQQLREVAFQRFASCIEVPSPSHRLGHFLAEKQKYGLIPYTKGTSNTPFFSLFFFFSFFLIFGEIYVSLIIIYFLLVLYFRYHRRQATDWRR